MGDDDVAIGGRIDQLGRRELESGRIQHDLGDLGEVGERPAVVRLAILDVVGEEHTHEINANSGERCDAAGLPARGTLDLARFDCVRESPVVPFGLVGVRDGEVPERVVELRAAADVPGDRRGIAGAGIGLGRARHRTRRRIRPVGA